MPELLLLMTALVVLACMGIAYARARDPLHPLMYLGPMLLYVYVVRPGLLLSGSEWEAFLTDTHVQFAALLFLLGVGALCVGVLAGAGGVRGRVQFTVTPAMRPRLVRLGGMLGFLSLASYCFCIYQGGGFLKVYSRSKAFLSSGSGWIDELVNLSVPALGLMVLAWGGERRYRHYLAWGLCYASPLLIHGLLGARRGPTFTILATLLVAWVVRSRRGVSLWKVTTRFGLICVLVMFLVSQRKQIYLGSDLDIDLGEFWNRVAPSEINTSDDTVFLYGFVNGVAHEGRHYWGARYAATYLVRPIPKQLWPTKYTDLGLGWMVDQSEIAGISDESWIETLGWVPTKGSAPGCVGDLFLEFSWLGVLGCFAFGGFYGWLWKRAVLRRGLWTLLFLQAAALSIYVPTQSVSAVLHRFLFMSVPISLVWTSYIQASPGRRQAVPRAMGSGGAAPGRTSGPVSAARPGTSRGFGR